MVASLLWHLYGAFALLVFMWLMMVSAVGCRFLALAVMSIISGHLWLTAVWGLLFQVLRRVVAMVALWSYWLSIIWSMSRRCGACLSFST